MRDPKTKTYTAIDLRSFAVAMLFVFASGLLTGCSYFFGPKTEENRAFVRKQDTSCMNDIGKNVELWFNGKDGDVGSSIDCAVTAINDFTSHVQGQDKSLYTRGELALFVETYLAEADSTLAGDTTEWMQQILNLKQIVFGGSADAMTKAEVARLRAFLLRARPILIELSPHMRTLLFQAENVPRDDVRKAREGLAKFSELIASELDRASVGRPAWTVDRLVTSLHRLSVQNPDMESWLPMGKVVKSIIIGGDQDQLAPEDWSPLVRLGTRAWGLAIQAKYDLLKNDEWLGLNFSSLYQVTFETLDLLAHGVAANGGSIENSKFQKLIDQLDTKDLLPMGITNATAKSLLPIAFGKVLYGRYKSDYQTAATAFGQPQLARLREIANDWLAGQTLVNSAFGVGATRKEEMNLNAVASGLSVRRAKTDFAGESLFNAASNAQRQLVGFFDKGRPPLFDDESRLVVVSRRELPNVKKSDADRINGLRVVVSAVLQGWSLQERNARGLVGLTEAEAQEVYVDLSTMGRELGVMDTRNTKAGERTFMENAIFMSSSNGDDFLSVHEGVEWFHYVMAGGVLADKMYKEMLPECGINQIDILGNRRLDIQCFRNRFLAIWSNHLTNLPHLISWVKADGTGARGRELLFALQSAGRNRGRTDHPLDSSEFRAMIPILQYMEGMFARFDENQNDILDHEEVWKAFPLLAPYIKKMAKGAADGEGMQRTILSYILEKRDVPATGIWDKAALVWWGVQRHFQRDSADRLTILTVIGSFGKSARNDRNREIAEFHKKEKKVLRRLFQAGGTSDSSVAAAITELFQCQKPVVPLISDLLQRQVNSLAPQAGPLEVDVFSARIKEFIARDPRLERLCLPF